MKRKLLFLFCACFILLNAVDMLIPRSEANIFDNAIRLHILAEDNGEEAQRVKLLVRDALLDEYGEMLSANGEVTGAEEAIRESLSEIEATANRVLAENGADYKAKATFDYEEYPTRVYENITLPAGEYRSLRINLGAAEGKNWWCILFPPLCTGASSEKDLSSAKINKKDTSVFSSRKYVFRFKLLELFW